MKKSSIVSSPNKSGVSEFHDGSSIDLEKEKEERNEEDLPEESTWTEYLADFSDYVRREEERIRGEEKEITSDDYSGYSRSDSMVSDAGTGPEWKLRNNNNNNNIDLHGGGGGMPPNMPKRLNFKNKRCKDIPYDDALEDTASSPVNSPKITTGLKRMDINSKRADETFDSYHGKGRALDHQDDDDDEHMRVDGGMEHETVDFKGKNVINYATTGGVEDCKELREKGLCLAPVTMLMNGNYDLRRF